MAVSPQVYHDRISMDTCHDSGRLPNYAAANFAHDQLQHSKAVVRGMRRARVRSARILLVVIPALLSEDQRPYSSFNAECSPTSRSRYSHRPRHLHCPPRLTLHTSPAAEETDCATLVSSPPHASNGPHSCDSHTSTGV